MRGRPVGFACNVALHTTEEKMEEQTKTRLHPLLAGAAVAVIIAAGVAVAAITGYLPGSNAEMAPEAKPATPQASHLAQQRQHLAAAKPAESRQHVAAAC